MYKTTSGLVLREVNYKESDKILTVLTADEGKLTVSARGARRKGSRIGAASQLLAYSDMTLFERNGRWSLNEAETIELFSGLRQDIGRLALGSYMAELLEAVSDEDSANPELLVLGLNCLYAASEGREPELVKSVFELRLMCLSGYTPELSACSVCGREDVVQPRLDLNGGTIRCAACRDGEGGASARLDGASLLAMRHIINAPSKRIMAFDLAEDSRKRLSNASEAYVLTQLERGFKTLDFYKQISV